MIKFIHCADVHLDAPFALNHQVPDTIMSDIKRSSFESFTRMITDAIMQKVDFVLIVGDLLDRRNQSLHTLIFLKEQFQRLNDAHIFVYIVRGEMDHMKHHRIQWPTNVVMFSEQLETYEFITKEGNVVYIHGFSYRDELSYENKISQYPANKVDNSIHIGMLHGTYVKADTQQRLTEFTKQDLNEKLYHYWALGHSHERSLISDLPHIHYPGNMQSYHPEETGKKGYLFVEGDHVTMDVVFVPTQYIRFEKASITITDTGKNAMIQEIAEFKDKVRNDGRAIYQLELINNSETLISNRKLEEIKHLVRAYESGQRNFVWIDEMTLTQPHDILTLHREFDKEVLMDEDIFQHAMDVLYHDESLNRFLGRKPEVHEEMLSLGEQQLKAQMREES